MGTSIAFAAASAALAVQAAPVTPPVSLEPTGPWTIDYADSMCVLSRQFGSEDQKLTLGFRPAPLGDNFRLGVLMTDSSKKVVRGTAQLQLDRNPPVEARFAKGPVKIDGLNIAAIDSTREDMAAISKASTLRITAGQLNVELKVGNTDAAMKALDACERDLLVSWGMDPKAVASLASYPTQRGGIGSLFSTDDYPHSAVVNNEQGTASVRIRVSREGKVSDCQVVESSGSDAIDTQTCRIILARARFQPARTKDGTAVDSIALQRIRWELPE